MSDVPVSVLALEKRVRDLEQEVASLHAGRQADLRRLRILEKHQDNIHAVLYSGGDGVLRKFLGRLLGLRRSRRECVPCPNSETASSGECT